MTLNHFNYILQLDVWRKNVIIGNLVEDLRFYLKDYFSRMDVVFHIEGKEVKIDTVFDTYGLLPVFLYRVNEVSDDYFRDDSEFYSRIEFVFNHDSMVEAVPLGEHNIDDFSVYKDSFLHILKNILLTTEMAYQGKTIYLDNLYYSFYQRVKEIINEHMEIPVTD